MLDYHTKQPGDALFLREDFSELSRGYYVLLSKEDEAVILCALGIDPVTDALVETELRYSVS